MTDADMFIVSEFDRGKQEIRPRFAIMKGTAVNVADFPPIALESEGMGTQSRVICSGEPLNIPDSILY